MHAERCGQWLNNFSYNKYITSISKKAFYSRLKKKEHCVSKCNEKVWKDLGCNAVIWNEQNRCYLLKVPQGVQPDLDSNIELWNIC